MVSGAFLLGGIGGFCRFVFSVRFVSFLAGRAREWGVVFVGSVVGFRGGNGVRVFFTF